MSKTLQKTLKNHFDPNNIMNPGGTLGIGVEKRELPNEENQYSKINTILIIKNGVSFKATHEMQMAYAYTFYEQLLYNYIIIIDHNL